MQKLSQMAECKAWDWSDPLLNKTFEMPCKAHHGGWRTGHHEGGSQADDGCALSAWQARSHGQRGRKSHEQSKHAQPSRYTDPQSDACHLHHRHTALGPHSLLPWEHIVVMRRTS